MKKKKATPPRRIRLASPKIGKFYGIGVGPGDPRLLTLYAAEVLRKVDVVFYATGANSADSVSGSVLKSVTGCTAQKVKLVFSMARIIKDRKSAWRKNAEHVAAALKRGADCAFVTIGDPLIYSTYSYLLQHVKALLPELEVETVPGITSFQVAAARYNLPLSENGEVLAVIPAIGGRLCARVLRNADTVVILKVYRNRREVLNRLKKYGFKGEFLYASRLGLDGERLRHDPDEIVKCPDEYLSLLIARRTRHATRMD